MTPIRRPGGLVPSRPAPSSPERPTGLLIALGCPAVFLAVAVAALIPAADTWARVLIVALAIGAYGIAIADLAASVIVSVVAWLFLTAFLIHRDGELAWSGMPDLVRLGLLILAAVAGTLLPRLRARTR